MVHSLTFCIARCFICFYQSLSRLEMHLCDIYLLGRDPWQWSHLLSYYSEPRSSEQFETAFDQPELFALITWSLVLSSYCSIAVSVFRYKQMINISSWTFATSTCASAHLWKRVPLFHHSSFGKYTAKSTAHRPRVRSPLQLVQTFSYVHSSVPWSKTCACKFASLLRQLRKNWASARYPTLPMLSCSPSCSLLLCTIVSHPP